MAERKKIIIDTDCGSDDAMAIAMALNDQRYQVMMITTVSGNVRVRQAASNALTTIRMTGTYSPDVYLGCDQMLKRDWVGASDTHGDDGMADLGLVDYSLKPAYGDAVEKMLEALRNSEPGEIDIITLGPLTNIAMAIRKDREAFFRCGRLVVMGSAGLGGGNVSPVAEFNLWQDGEAADEVLTSGFDPIIFVGWDACLDDAMLNHDEIEQIRNSSPLGCFCIDSNSVLLKLNRSRFGDDYLDMADPAAMAAALYPQCIEHCEKYFCQMDTSDGPSYGSLLVDRYHFSGKPKNAYLVSKLRADLFKDYLKRMLKAE